MHRLAELQRDFAASLRRGEPAALGIKPSPLGPERRIAIYRNHHRISLAGALAANFPVTARVVGEDAFRTLATDFLAAQPPAEPCLSAYGGGLADFLERDGRVQALPYLVDVARFDWAFNCADRAEDTEPFGPQHLQALDEEWLAKLMLRPHPSLTLLSSPYPLLRIRNLAFGNGDDGISLDTGGVALMIWRRGGAVSCESLDPAAFSFAAKLAHGAMLGEAAAGLDAERLPQVLAATVLTGAFVTP